MVSSQPFSALYPPRRKRAAPAKTAATKPSSIPQDFAAEVKRLTAGRGVDVVYDSVARTTGCGRNRTKPGPHYARSAGGSGTDESTQHLSHVVSCSPIPSRSGGCGVRWPESDGVGRAAPVAAGALGMAIVLPVTETVLCAGISTEQRQRTIHRKRGSFVL